MADSSGKKLARAVGKVFLSLANATLLLVLCCLCVGIWGAFKVEQIAERIMVRTERTLVSAVAPHADRLVDGLHQMQLEIRRAGDSVQKLTVAIDGNPSVTLPPGIAKEAERLIHAADRLTTAVEAVSADDFHLSQKTWQHIANTAGEVVTTAIACRRKPPTRPMTDG